jgi:hypothetical protein
VSAAIQRATIPVPYVPCKAEVAQGGPVHRARHAAFATGQWRAEVTTAREGNGHVGQAIVSARLVLETDVCANAQDALDAVTMQARRAGFEVRS